jgi:hypothetical protein
MAYVNEKISKEDWEKYNLSNIDKRYGGGQFTNHWTIDRERERWFRLYLTVGDQENSGAEICTYWNFYWKNNFILVKTKTIDRRRSDDGVCYGYLKILKLEIPSNVLQYKAQILKDLKEAFEASLIGLGIYATKTKSCKVDFEYEGELI